MLYDDIKKQNIEAMKRRDSIARGIYSVLISKMDLIRITKKESDQELNDADCIGVIQKTLKELEDEQSNFKKVNNQERVNSIGLQMEYIRAFLPIMLSEDEVKKIIDALEDKSIPSIMKHFKVNYAGKCDMGMVNKIAKIYN